MSLPGFWSRSRATVMMLCAFCGFASSSAAKFDPAPFESDKAQVVLGIDLHDESAISMGLIIRDGNAHPAAMAGVALPFSTTNAGGNEQIISTWGSYGGATFLSFVLPGSGTSYYPVELMPVIRRSSGPENGPSRDAITFIEDGQARTFIYRYLPEKPAESATAAFTRTGGLPIDAVAVLLPEDARATEVKQGKTSDPPDLFYVGRVGFYPATQQGTSDRLELRYWLPATEGQKAFVEFLTKFFALLAAPIATIIATKATSKIAGARRHLVIIGGIAVQCVVFGLITMVWFRWAGATSTSNLIDMGIGALGVGISIIVWWIG